MVIQYYFHILWQLVMIQKLLLTRKNVFIIFFQAQVCTMLQVHLSVAQTKVNSSVILQNCHIKLNKERPYCFINRDEIECYASSAVEFIANNTLPFPLWIQACIFHVPEFFVDNEEYFDCKIEVEGGVVTCKLFDNATIITALKSFQRHCRFGLFYLDSEKLVFTASFYQNLLLSKKFIPKFRPYFQYLSYIYFSFQGML